MPMMPSYRSAALPAKNSLNQPHNIVRHPDTPHAVFRHVVHRTRASRRRGTLKSSKDGAFYWVDTCVVPVRQHDCTIGYMSVRQAADPDAIAAAGAS